jgi:phage terminase large subunit-like protein
VVAKAIRKLFGYDPMPWQQQVLDVGLEMIEDEDTGLMVPAYPEVDLLVPRQSGKTTLTLGRQTWRCQRKGRHRCAYTAQTRHDAWLKFKEEFFPVLAASGYVGEYKEQRTSGSEGILWNKNRSTITVGTPSETGGHGQVLDDVTLDEAFAHRDGSVEQGFRPAMITRPESQLWVVSTAGHPAKALFLKQKRDNGRHLVNTGVREGVAYFEWSAHDEDDPTDEEVWYRTMPALGFTQTIRKVRAEFLGMKMHDFQRAYLNQWVEDQEEAILNLSAWDSCFTLREQDQLSFEDPPVLCVGVDVNPERSWASISGAGQALVGDVPFVELIDRREGTGWLTDRLVEIRDRYHPIAIVVDGKSPAASLIDEWERAGLDLQVIDSTFQVRACGNMKDRVTLMRFAHRSQTELNDAVKNAGTRPLADAWAWNRKTSKVDISPLVASTLALEAWMQNSDSGSSGVY